MPDNLYEVDATIIYHARTTIKAGSYEDAQNRAEQLTPARRRTGRSPSDRLSHRSIAGEEQTMHIVHSYDKLYVTRQLSDPKFYSDSLLLYHIKRGLQKQGLDVVKKEMVKDGHLVSPGQYYLRDRKWDFAYWFGLYQISKAYEDFNAGGVILAIERWASAGDGYQAELDRIGPGARTNDDREGV